MNESEPERWAEDQYLEAQVDDSLIRIAGIEPGTLESILPSLIEPVT